MFSTIIEDKRYENYLKGGTARCGELSESSKESSIK